LVLVLELTFKTTLLEAWDFLQALQNEFVFLLPFSSSLFYTPSAFAGAIWSGSFPARWFNYLQRLTITSFGGTDYENAV